MNTFGIRVNSLAPKA